MQKVRRTWVNTEQCSLNTFDAHFASGFYAASLPSQRRWQLQRNQGNGKKYAADGCFAASIRLVKVELVQVKIKVVQVDRE